MTDEKPTRTENVLKSRKLIEEYIHDNFDSLLQIKNGSIIVQIVCLDLGIMDSPLLVELTNTIWQDLARVELGRRSAKQELKQDLAKTTPGPDQKPLPDPAVDPRTNNLLQQVEKEHQAILEVFGEALEYLTLELERSRMGILERAVNYVKAKMRAKTRS